MDEPPCHFSWFQKEDAKIGELLEPRLMSCTKEPWAKFVSNLNLAYFFFIQDRIIEAVSALSEAESLLMEVPENLKEGFRLVMDNLERKFNNLPGGKPMPEEAEAKAAVLTVKALAKEGFKHIFGNADCSVKSVLADIREARQLNTESLILKYLQAYYQWWCDDMEFHLVIPRLECFQLYFEVMDQVQGQNRNLNVTSVRVAVALVVAEALSTFRKQFTRMEAFWPWSSQQLRTVMEEDEGTLSAYHALKICIHSMHIRRYSSLVDRFFRKYIEIYPDNTKLMFRYGRFLCEVKKDKERGEEMMRNLAQNNNIDAIQGVVYLAKIVLQARSVESVKTVEKMFQDFERRVSDAANSVRFFIYRGGFRYYVMKKKKEAFSDWMKAIEINPDRQLIRDYSQDWENNGRSSTINPADIMLKELPQLMAASNGDERQFFAESLQKVQDFLHSRDGTKPKAEAKEFTPAPSPQDIRLLENLLWERLQKGRTF